MMPASNKGAGMSMGFPDTCLTPAAPSPVPVPYPNMGMNAQVMPFSIIVRVCGMNAINMSGKPTMTSGMEAGASHPMYKLPGGYAMGNPIVRIEKQGAICLLCPTHGNNMNNPVGAVTVPSVVNVFFTAVGATSEPSALDLEDLGLLARMLDGNGGWLGVTCEVRGAEDGLRVVHVRRNGLAETMGLRVDDVITQLTSGDTPVELGREIPVGERCRVEVRRPGAPESMTLEAVIDDVELPAVRSCLLRGRVGYAEVSVFNFQVPTLLHQAVRRLADRGAESLILDLRDNPGGDEESFVRLAEDFLEPGEVISRSVEVDGDTIIRRARRPAAYGLPLVLLVNQGTASAAELFATCIQDNRRGHLVGKSTFGKSLARRIVADPADGKPRWVDVACHTRSDGQALQGAGVVPDVDVPDVTRDLTWESHVAAARGAGLFETYLDEHWDEHKIFLQGSCDRWPPPDLGEYPDAGNLVADRAVRALPSQLVAREIRRAIRHRGRTEMMLCCLADDPQLRAALMLASSPEVRIRE